MTGLPTAGPGSAGWVIDASVTMPWFFPDEATPFTERLLDSLGAHELWAPPLWVLECTNVLQSAQRRRRIDANRRAQIAGELSELPVRLDREPPNFVSLDRLAATHGLSAYDAAYLELALRRSLVLVSLDARLLAAAQALGHPALSAQQDISS
ncbi:MAG: type II toxin-antitoxin system VapC family toxin [Burkholderiales bacterium]|nr:type II toxin-antitoxin system VapC family toxin [Burkholderiales bacterium]